jgi:16S rRNA (uracil1498-N3)-methyltransferase
VNLFYQPLIPKGIFHLDPEESRHCIKVLRKNEGDEIRITDGLGHFYDAVITKADFRECGFTVAKTTAENPKNFSIHIAIAPTKNADRLEWFVEKATELGIDKITILDTKHTERTFLKKDRLQKVAISAMKQSLKATLPVIEALTPIEDFIRKSTEDERYIAYVDFENPHHLQKAASRSKQYLILIGPEGDFSTEEVSAAMQAGFVKVSLGNSRLRTETAGLAACHILNLINT